MTDPVLTRDNLHLSRPTIEPECLRENVAEALVAAPQFAINCNFERFIEAGVAQATKAAYRADLDHFRGWGGDIPTTEAQLVAYLAEHATTLKPATLVRRLGAISVAHEAQGSPSPTRSPLVRAVMRGIRRQQGVAQRQAKPLRRDDLFATLTAMGDRVKDDRDRALLLIGFAGGFRRSELCAIDCRDLEHVRQGVVITIRRSKTDQVGEGRRVGVPLGRTKWCPVRALDRWLDRGGIKDGPVFRRVDRHGRVLPKAMSGEAICLVVQERVAAAGYDTEGFSAHSLRAGLATSAAEAGVATWRIRQQTGHASDAMVGRYVRDGQLFLDNAAGALL